ncbi:unnamed protein product [Wuchereria bancrofti]|uniref:Uncharacterized protein n=1 Tax=Wuchereria bancrofti TaxID=6293 RepID=A0A3P7EAG5_WUCBA|nr:unnamed protein product [Wuchereria bancrofti]
MCNLEKRNFFFFFECGEIRCGENIAYVAVGIIFRERDDGNLELLLTQEAKRRCLGKFVINYFINYIENVFSYV